MLYGACDAVVRAPNGAFVEALDHLVRVVDPEQLRAALGPTGGELSRLLPELGGEPSDADPDTIRHRLHTAVADLLAGVGKDRPVLLVLEDAHWADGPTLGLLRHLARGGARARLLVLATFRDTDVPDALGETLADLRRSEDVVRLRLAGLTGDEVAELVRARRGDRRSATIRELTGGNSVPRLRALALVRRHGRAGHARERARGRQRAARAACARDRRPARAGGDGRAGVRARRAARRRGRRASARCWPRSTRRSTAA